MAGVGQCEGGRPVTESVIAASYDSARFEATTAERIAGHLRTVLTGVITAGPQALVGDLQVATASELALIDSWNATQVDWGTEETLVSLFAQAVEQWPDRVALVYENRSLTYMELGQAAAAVATELRAQGVGNGSMVGVLCERSIELVAALHGVVMVGAAYVPLDPEYPEDRLAYMISETEMEVVLCQDRFRHLVEDASVKALDVEAVANREGTDASPADFSEGVSPDDVAYVIYTSGSTGRPKGVANAHRGVANRLLWMQDHYRLSPENVAFQKTPFSFDVSVWEFFWPFETGARLVVARPDGHKDPAYLIETINAHQVDTIHFVPSMLRLFLDHPAAGTCSSLRRVICSGEALTRDLQDRFFDVLPDAELHNLYGPTEAAIDVTAWECRPDDTLPVVPIGRPIANTTIDILDADMRPVPIGVPAELYIGGVQVAARLRQPTRPHGRAVHRRSPSTGRPPLQDR
jgi:amino acid adenylation domain-containing protein